MENKGIIGKVAEGFAESTRTVHQINKENLAAVKADTKANFAEATAPDPGFEKFKEAKGFGNKVKVIAENIKEGARENSEKEKERRTEIQSHDSYRTLLEDQRAKRQAVVKRS
ncbi:MAG: hypothetical protein FWD39_04695 [Clostridiales bacterium]|nr:hypothetical protein [Clostridiales bacterium]